MHSCKPETFFNDDKYHRLKILADQRGISINQLFNEMATLLLSDFDAETRFKLRAERGLDLLKKAME